MTFPWTRSALSIFMLLTVLVVNTQATCDLCHDNKWVFVVATGRSGSTTIMSMLNSVPGMYISGENLNIEGSFLDLITKATTTGFDERLKNKGAWAHKKVNRTKLLCDLQLYARDAIGVTPNLKPTIEFIGWKEIRYGSIAQLDFLLTLFPCAKIIVNVRKDVMQQYNSQKKSWHLNHSTADEEADVRSLQKRTDMTVAWEKKQNPANTFFLPLEEFTIERFNEMIRWIGVDSGSCVFKHIAHTNFLNTTTNTWVRDHRNHCISERNK
eukprot:m.268400 g.268400  ORF g.268400 m.268400 type:complete len:268 (+) comp78342_c0_seq1:188-991(+)